MTKSTALSFFSIVRPQKQHWQSDGTKRALCAFSSEISLWASFAIVVLSLPNV
jgi:hypothetical protein